MILDGTGGGDAEAWLTGLEQRGDAENAEAGLDGIGATRRIFWRAKLC